MNTKRFFMSLTMMVLLLAGICPQAQAGAGKWSPAASMATDRDTYTATLLQNGKVLVVGGHNTNSSPLSSAELYNPATNSWSSAGNMSLARMLHTATLLPNGKVLVVGGETTGGATLSSVELYDPATNSWSSAGNMSVARAKHAATLLPNGKVLAVGGVGTGNSLLSSAELYDPATNNWSNAAGMSKSRDSHTSTLLANGKVLVAGGTAPAMPSPLPVKSVEVYDPVANSWTDAASMLTERGGHTATRLQNGKVLVVAGGGINSGLAVGTAQLYDPVANSWSSAGSISSVRYDHTATLLSNGNVLVAGGSTYGGAILPPTTTDLYNPATNSWSSAADLPAGRYAPTATLLADGRVLLAGGLGLKTTDLYVGGGVLQYSSPAYAGDVAAGSVTLTVNRTGPGGGTASVNYASADGSAVAGSDYTAVTGTLTWADGDTVGKTITVPILPAGGNKSFSVMLSNVVNDELKSPNYAIVSITDNSVLNSCTSSLTTCQTSLASCPADKAVMGIATDSGGNLFAALKNHGIYKFPYGGSIWGVSNGNAPNNLTNLDTRSVVVDRNSATRLYTATYGGGVFTSANSGVDWSACATQPTSLNVLSLKSDPSGKLFAGTGAGIFVSADSCASWIPMSSGLP